MSDGSRIEEARPKHRVAGTVDADVVVLTLDKADATADLTLVIEAAASLELHFRADRFDERAISRIAGHLGALLAGMAETPGPVSAIPIVTGEERAWVLACSCVGAVRLDEPLPSVVERFEAHVRRSPAAVAVIDEDRELTYGQLDDAANALCDRLRARGVAAGDRVAVYLERGADAVVAFLAVLKARATYVPIDTAYPAGRVEAILASAAPRLVVTRVGLAPRLPNSAARGETHCSVLFVDELRALSRWVPERRGPASSRRTPPTRFSRRGRRGSPRASSSVTAPWPTTRGPRSMLTTCVPRTACCKAPRWASI